MDRVYFATNRQPNRQRNPDGFKSGFGEGGIANLKFGLVEYEVETSDQIKIRDIYLAPEKPKGNQGNKSQAHNILASLNLFQRIREDMIEHARDTVLFIHGYNVDFEDAITSAARLQRSFSTQQGGPGVSVALFSWPSDGSMSPYVAYGDDRGDAAISGPALARALLKLTDFLRGSTHEEACNHRIHLIAHSMGNHVLRHAIQEFLRQSSGRVPRLFDEVMLLAADEDEDAFEHEHKLLHLPKFAKRVSVYFNNEDQAMAVSDMTKGNPDRLGNRGPRVPHSLPAKVTLVEITAVVDAIIGHSYFLDSPRVMADMKQVLIGKPADAIDGRNYVPGTNSYRLE